MMTKAALETLIGPPAPALSDPSFVRLRDRDRTKNNTILIMLGFGPRVLSLEERGVFSVRIRYVAILWLLLLTSNIALLIQNLQLRNEINSFQMLAAGEIATPDTLLLGDTVPSLKLGTLEGKAFEIEYLQGKKFLLLYFSPECIICTKQFPLWLELAQKLQGSGYQVVALVSDQFTKKEVKDYLEAVPKPRMPVLFADGIARQVLKLGPTPNSIVIGDGGLIIKVWLGGWRPNTQSDVSRFFGVALTSASPFREPWPQKTEASPEREWEQASEKSL